MKRYIFILAILFLYTGVSFGQEAAGDPHNLFFKGNSFYEKRDYEKAIEKYRKIVDLNMESGPLYYNIGNAYFKMGRIGYAILYYKKAHGLMPGDSDLRSNLAYAQSLTEDSALQPHGTNRAAWLIKLPFRYFNLNTVALTFIMSYLILIIFFLI